MALSVSSNANEAAIALRQAQSLMQSFTIEPDELDEDGLEAICEVSQVNRGDTMPIYSVRLANVIGQAFGVENFKATHCIRPRMRSKLVFVGPRSRAEVAVYAFVVLLRQLERDRRQHLSRVKKAKNREARGDTFGLGWVHAVQAQLKAFAGYDQDKPRIAAWLARKHPGLKEKITEARKSKAVTHADLALGHRAGSKAQLHRGMPGDTVKPRLEHKS